MSATGTRDGTMVGGKVEAPLGTRGDKTVDDRVRTTLGGRLGVTLGDVG
jgi:hypothetical protein